MVEATLWREVMDELRPAVALLHRISPMRRNPRRSECLVPVLSRLREFERSGGLSQGLDAVAASDLHLHVNRMPRDTPRAHELVLFDILERFHASFRARGMYLEPVPRADKECLG